MANRSLPFVLLLNILIGTLEIIAVSASLGLCLLLSLLLAEEPALSMDPQNGIFGWMQLSPGRLGCQVWITVAAITPLTGPAMRGCVCV